MTTPMNARTALREFVAICMAGLIGGSVAAAVVLPFAALGIAWGTVIVLTVLVTMFALLVRNYHQVLLFAIRRGPGDVAAWDSTALTELFDAFAAERRAEGTGHAGRVLSGRGLDTWLFGLSKWLAGWRRLGVNKGPARPANR